METKGLKIEYEQAKQAAEALRSCMEKWKEDKSKIKSLFDDPSNSPILLQFTLKKIPEQSGIYLMNVCLPHSLLTETSEVCLITGDLDKNDRRADIEPTVRHYKELLAKHGITGITEIIPLRQLRTEYITYEAKRRLSVAYDTFIADSMIIRFLPQLLGKFFFKRRKFPKRIHLDAYNLKDHYRRVTSGTTFHFTGRGASCFAAIAHFGLSTEQIAENIVAAVNTLKYKIPGRWQNIRGLYIKTQKSLAIPLYISQESADNADLPVMKNDDDDDVEAEELTTLHRSKVKVYRDGNVELVPNLENNSSEDENGFEERLLEKEKVLKARKIMKELKRNKQICEIEKTPKKKTSLNCEGEASLNECPKGTEESFEDKSFIDVHMKKLKKQTRKKKKISVDISIAELKEPVKKKKKIAVDFNIKESKEPAKKKKKIAVDFNIEELKELAKQRKMDTLNNKRLKRLTMVGKETGSNINIKGVKAPAAKKKKKTDINAAVKEPTKKKRKRV